MRLTRKLDQRGQGMTEYILVVALVAIAAIGVVGIFGDNVRQLFGTSADALAGEDAATTNATQAGNATGHRTLTNFAGAAVASDPVLQERP